MRGPNGVPFAAAGSAAAVASPQLAQRIENRRCRRTNGRIRRQFDFVVFAHHHTIGLFAERQAATAATRRRVILEGGGILVEAARMALMPGPGPAGLRVLAPLLPIGRRRLRGIARRLLRALQPQHHLDQIVLAERSSHGDSSDS